MGALARSRYHARSAAIILAHAVGAKVLLGSATPSVDSYYNATIGKYGLVSLSERYAGLQLPKITLIDLKRQYHRKEMYGHFSDPLVDRIREELFRHKQVILFQASGKSAAMRLCCNVQPAGSPRAASTVMYRSLTTNRPHVWYATIAVILFRSRNAALPAAGRCAYGASGQSVWKMR